MSEMLDNIFTKNFRNLTLDDALLQHQPQVKAPNHSRLTRSTSFFAPPSPPASSRLSLSTDHVSGGEDGGSSIWSPSIWSQGPVSQEKQHPFRPDRAMSLTESGSALLSSFGQLNNLEGFPTVPNATTVAPPPGFSNLPPQVQPMLSSNRYKTELCRGFQETGSCKYGSKCQFAHGEAELRGLYRHPKYKTEHCRTFYNFGYCPYGSRCHFIHEDKISGGPMTSSKFQRQLTSSMAGGPNPRHQLRQSVSFAGFLDSSRTSPPPSFLSSFNDPNPVFSRAPSVSPPPADHISPVFGDNLHRESAAFHIGKQRTRASTGDIHNIPLILEPKVSRCSCGHGNDFSTVDGKKGRSFASMEEEKQQDRSLLLAGPGGFIKLPGMQRFSSEDSLEDSYSSSSSGSSGSESPTFDSSATKRLNVFERLSLSD